MIVHGFKTPHKFPNFDKENLLDIFGNLALDLYPTGEAFQFEKLGIADKTHTAINKSFVRLINDAFGFLDAQNPFMMDIEDCRLWEYRLGIITNESLNLEQRQKAILRKLTQGRNVKYRHTKDYIESQLRLAGFDVYVFENTKPYKTPENLLSLTSSSQHGSPSQHGTGQQHGSNNFQIIANSILPNENFAVGSQNIWATFFICGSTLGEIATIPQNRETEFRELVLRLKPAHLVAYTFINYI